MQNQNLKLKILNFELWFLIFSFQLLVIFGLCGCAVVEYKASGEYSIFPIRIDQGVALWNGKEFQGRDRLEDLRKDLPGWHWQ